MTDPAYLAGLLSLDGRVADNAGTYREAGSILDQSTES